MKYIIWLLIAFFLISPLRAEGKFIGLEFDKWAHLYEGSTFVAARDKMGVGKEQAIMELIMFAIVKEVIVDGWIGGWKPSIADFGTTMIGGILFQVAFR